MEKRKNALSALKLCRFCLSQDVPLFGLYDKTQGKRNSVTLPLKILSSISVEVFPSDKMPSYICHRCKFFMELCYEYKKICRLSDETILHHVQNGTPLESIAWPPSLMKIFRSPKPNKTSVIKAVVEGGATVQVTSQDMSDSEDDEDEDVYNIQIGEGFDEESKSGSANIKVNQLEITKEKPKQTRKGFSTVSKLAKHVRTHAGERAYPCKYCNKSFIKSHHYTRHLRVKHRESVRTSRGPSGDTDQYRCEQCESTFETQDELFYHSAIHTTQNLTCPLCQEKFANVEAVTAHIKSHVSGVEFMCDFCELVFISKENLDNHVMKVHEDGVQEEQMDESSMDAEDDEDGINVKEEDDHMVVEIKKPDDFMLPNIQSETEEKVNNTNSEESEAEATYTELSTVDTLAVIRKVPVKGKSETTPIKSAAEVTGDSQRSTASTDEKNNSTASILRKAEEMKRKVVQQQTSEPNNVPTKKAKVETISVGASDKSLRLLEKELQDLKRTNTRSGVKTPAKPVEVMKNRRPPFHTSTPKLRGIEEKKSQVSNKLPMLEKKQLERRVLTKENKEPKEPEKKNNTSTKEDKEKDVKEKETPKGVVKNGASDKSGTEEGVRRSTRPSKIKDYAKMIRDSSNADDDDDDSEYEADEEYKEMEKSTESRGRGRPSSVKPLPKPATALTPATAAAPPKKRGRPRKENKDRQIKPKKDENEDNEEEDNGKQEKSKLEESGNSDEQILAEEKADTAKKNANTENKGLGASKSVSSEQQISNSSGVVVSPSGQTLKKVPIKSLPPGIKPLPLPVNARHVSAGELCEMQIGKKVVKVQKIVMTKAEVEAMAKKGLVEMKDGTMVLKQGIKLPTADPVAIKSTLVGEEASKESPIRKEKGTPTRCDLEDNS